MGLLALSLVLILAIAYGYLNGLHGSASVVSTMISSRALRPRAALFVGALGIGVGPFVLGVAVANTIGSEFVSEQATTSEVAIAALVGAIIWSTLTLWLQIPSSISQSLIGGIMGAVWAGFGLASLQSGGIIKVMIALFISPILGLIGAYIILRLTYLLTASATPHINRWLNRAQILASFFLAVAFGANDGQKIIAMMVMGLLATGALKTFMVPEWVIAISALSITIGALVGGWRLIHTLGGRFYKIRPLHGFTAQLASGAIIFGAGIWGGPVSGSQVVTSAILGAGSADRIQQIRWGIVKNILIGWLLTIPCSAVIGALAYQFIERFII